MTSGFTLGEIVSEYGAALKPKLSSASVVGAPEDQLRNPLEVLVQKLASLIGYPSGAIHLVGETTITALSTRPDFALTLHNALVGHIEVKAPGKGADPRKFSEKHDKDQWIKLRSLPNLLYTDGANFGLWRNGELVGSLVAVEGDISKSGKALKAPPALQALFQDFLSWNPIPPDSAKALAEVAARLCRLLRDEVIEELGQGSKSLGDLARDWRHLLFPQANDAQFADGYAQAVTFGLLMAKSHNLSLAGGIDHAAVELKKSSSLIGSALRLLTDDPKTRKSLETSLDTLVRVLDTVDWTRLSKGKSDAWLYFYEDFLAVYDNELRKKTGSYYTPPEVVGAMVRLVDEALKSPVYFGRSRGLADTGVRIADPACGTGTYMLCVLRQIASNIEADIGAGAVAGEIDAAIQRLVGFELQFGPFAVAQLRIMAEIIELMGNGPEGIAAAEKLRVYVTDTLGNPYEAATSFSSMLAPIGRSRQEANKIKRDEEITVVIGNPPYKEKAKGKGGWIEEGSPGRVSPLSLWMPPSSWGVGAHAKHLRNLYVYFWRWATWKVFGSGFGESTGEPEADRAGIVCFITVAGFLNGPGFQKMRAELRRDCSNIWVIDCSPEGHQPGISTRVFQGVQQPVCIVLALKKKSKPSSMLAKVVFRALAPGDRRDKFKELATLSLADKGWVPGPSGLRDPFLGKAKGAWASFLGLEDAFYSNDSGVMPGRTWVIAPDPKALAERWNSLIQEKDLEKKQLKFHPHLNRGQLGDRHIQKVVSQGLPDQPNSLRAIASESGPVAEPVRYAFRTLDRQWIIPDMRVLNRPNPGLWRARSDAQVYLTAPEDRTPSAGPSVTFCGHIPDLHHYNGRGGRVYPLWLDNSATSSNLRASLLSYLSVRFALPVRNEDFFAYVAAVLAHPGFTRRFAADLKQPGLRIPMTGNKALFQEAVKIGREIVWLHCYGEKMDNLVEGRPYGPPRLPKGESPVIPAGHGIPGAPSPLPDNIAYDPATKRISIGSGRIDNVPKAVWDYEISGKNVIKQWFSYRRLDRTKPPMGDKRPPSPLDAIQAESWLPAYTSDFIDLLHVLGRLTKLEPLQDDLLDRISSGPMISRSDLEAAGALADAPKVSGVKKAKVDTTLSLF